MSGILKVSAFLLAFVVATRASPLMRRLSPASELLKAYFSGDPDQAIVAIDDFWADDCLTKIQLNEADYDIPPQIGHTMEYDSKAAYLKGYSDWIVNRGEAVTQVEYEPIYESPNSIVVKGVGHYAKDGSYSFVQIFFLDGETKKVIFAHMLAQKADLSSDPHPSQIEFMNAMKEHIETGSSDFYPAHLTEDAVFALSETCPSHMKFKIMEGRDLISSEHAKWLSDIGPNPKINTDSMTFGSQFLYSTGDIYNDDYQVIEEYFMLINFSGESVKSGGELIMSDITIAGIASEKFAQAMKA